ncbi:sigma-70 region 4 domain-containing protein [Streptacidiphilus sp. P02-A3a]|uniref:sigma-70 region 4 domain-containing protein n=1 Tax=Streptacidiphilus sp. P02-A3a TaxID=2704468 RepID=UPI0015FE6110|nr:sigma-70 region 4 domain-containing protein [Streptacidiphilus sp. P02-A3a]QMU67300.1 MarR family transcriptional regulator [Streptacidiphilus sp. P02-A3a]
MADDQQLWGYPEIAAHLGISVRAARSRKSRGTIPDPDDTSVPDRPRWRPTTFQDWRPLGRGFRSDLHGTAARGIEPTG